MTREDIVWDLRGRVMKNHISNIKELEQVCKEHNLDSYEDILSPIEWNCCDRCGQLGDIEYDLHWLEYGFFDYIDDNPKAQAMLRGYEKEGAEYACVCDECAEQLAEVGGWVDTPVSQRS